MNSMFTFDSLNMIAWALVHFLWQGTLIGLVAWLLNTGFLRRNSQACYVVNVAMLCLLVACVPLTLLYSQSNRVDELVYNNMAFLTHGEAVEPAQSEAKPIAALSTNQTAKTAERTSKADTPAPTLFPAVVLGAYVLGLLIMLMRFAVAAAETMRLRRSATLIQLDSLMDMMRNQARAIGLRAVPLVASCDELVTPIVIGLFRPMILLPSTLLSNISTSEIEAVLVHELAHIRRYDLWLNVFQKLAESLLFFHPAVWYINHIIDTSREVCCDEMVVRTGHRPLDYASALIRIAELAERAIGTRSENALALSATGKRSSGFKQRVLRLLSDSTAIKTNISEMLCLALVMAAAFYFSLGIIAARETQAAEQAKSASTPAASESQTPAQDAVVDENLPKTPEEWEEFHAENKRKSIEKFNAHPFSNILRAYVSQPKKEYAATGTFAWKGDYWPAWQTNYSVADEVPQHIGLHYSTDGILRMDMDYKKGTLQSYDNLNAKSYTVFHPTKPLPIPVSSEGTPYIPANADAGRYPFADIVNDVNCKWMRGGTSRFGHRFWPFELHWLYDNLSKGYGEVTNFDPVEGQSNVYSLKLSFPPTHEYVLRVDGEQLEVLSIKDTDKARPGLNTLTYENKIIDGCSMPVKIEHGYESGDNFVWSMDYTQWGGSRPFEAELKILQGYHVNDQPGRNAYVQPAEKE